MSKIHCLAFDIALGTILFFALNVKSLMKSFAQSLGLVCLQTVFGQLVKKLSGVYPVKCEFGVLSAFR